MSRVLQRLLPPSFSGGGNCPRLHSRAIVLLSTRSKRSRSSTLSSGSSSARAASFVFVVFAVISVLLRFRPALDVPQAHGRPQVNKAPEREGSWRGRRSEAR